VVQKTRMTARFHKLSLTTLSSPIYRGKSASFPSGELISTK